MLVFPSEPTVERQDIGLISKYRALLDMIVRGSDIVIVGCSAYLAHLMRFNTVSLDNSYKVGVILVALLTALIFPTLGVYRSWRGEKLRREIARCLFAWLAVLATFLAIEWALKNTDEYSRVWFATWSLSSALLLAVSRVIVRLVLRGVREQGSDMQRVILIGATGSGAKIVSATGENPWTGLQIVGYIATPFDRQTLDVPCLGSIENLANLLPKLMADKPDQIWIALPMRAESFIKQVLDVTNDVPTTVRLIPDLFGYELINHRTTTLAGVPVITLRGSRIEGHLRIFKALEDRLLALIFLTFLSPLMLLIACGVKWSSPGPIFYKQKRHGLYGKEIHVWKFRSMRVHQEKAGKITQATQDDPRVTSFGRFLRSSSLDELPQFINVLQGRMSIVGPRPHAVEHNYHFSAQLRGYMQRHGVKPGITGLAQISGFRGETDTLDKMRQRVDLDIEYIQNWSLLLDLKIVMHTPFAMLKRTNAF